MKKFRIVKEETLNGNNEIISTWYKIQKRFLYWYFDYSITIHYTTVTEQNTKPYEMALLKKYKMLYKTEDRAIEVLNKIKNPYVENYKGNKIISVFNFKCDETYINKSYYDIWAGLNGYEFSSSLLDLKEMIDKRIKTVKETPILKIN